MRRVRDELMMNSSIETSSSSPKSTTIEPRIRWSLVADKWDESRLVLLLFAGLSCKTSSNIVEVTSSYKLVFLPFPFPIISLSFLFFSLAFSSSFFFFSTSFKLLFSKASLTFSTFALSYAMSLSRTLSSKLAKLSSSNTFPPAASKDLNLSTSKVGTCWGPNSIYQATPRRWAEFQVCSCLGENMQSGE